MGCRLRIVGFLIAFSGLLSTGALAKDAQKENKKVDYTKEFTSKDFRKPVYKGVMPWTGLWTPGDTVDNVGYKPDQPIAFSHKLHAGEMEISCQYCHNTARRAASAGIPPGNLCMGCHKIVGNGKPEVQKVRDAYKNKKAVEWVKVHDLPDFVRFTHKRHVQSGVDCASCHGDVKKMTVAEQVAPLQMGWCIDCHSEKGAKKDCETCHY